MTDSYGGSFGRMYDREGNPIDFERYCELYQDPDYKILKQTKVRKTLVSTVWLGFDHCFWDGPPLIFETMAFDQRTAGPNRIGDELACVRYSTEEEALADHKRVVLETTTWWDRNYWWALPIMLFLLTFTLTFIATHVY